MRIIKSPIVPSDDEFLFSLYEEIRANEMMLVPWNKEQKHAFLQHQFQAQDQHYKQKYPNAFFQLLELNKEKIGRFYICELEYEIRIIDLTILPEYRGKGFGTEIISDVLQKAAKPVRIYLEKFNRSATLFKRLGFQVIGEEGIYQFWECASVGKKKFEAAA